MKRNNFGLGKDYMKILEHARNIINQTLIAWIFFGICACTYGFTGNSFEVFIEFILMVPASVLLLLLTRKIEDLWFKSELFFLYD